MQKSVLSPTSWHMAMGISPMSSLMETQSQWQKVYGPDILATWACAGVHWFANELIKAIVLHEIKSVIH